MALGTLGAVEKKSRSDARPGSPFTLGSNCIGDYDTCLTKFNSGTQFESAFNGAMDEFRVYSDLAFHYGMITRQAADFRSNHHVSLVINLAFDESVENPSQNLKSDFSCGAALKPDEDLGLGSDKGSRQYHGYNIIKFNSDSAGKEPSKGGGYVCGLVSSARAKICNPCRM